MNKRIILVGNGPQKALVFLKQNGFKLISLFKTGREALAELKKPQPVDLVITDIKLPDMDGFIFLQEIKKTPAPPPFIIITSVDKNLAGNAASKEGTFGYFNIPFDENLLLKRINYALRFKEIFEDSKVKRLPQLKQIKGKWGEKIKTLIENIKNRKICQAKEKLAQGTPQRTLEIGLFLRNLGNDAEVEELINMALTSPQKNPVEKTEKDLKKIIRQAWDCYLKEDFDSALEICKTLLLEEEASESVKILNAILSREEIEEEEKIEKKEIRKMESKSAFAYISLIFLLAGIFLKPVLFASLACICGIIAIHQKAKRPGFLAISGGILLVFIHLTGIASQWNFLNLKPRDNSPVKLFIKNKIFRYSDEKPITLIYKVKSPGIVKLKVLKSPEKKAVKTLINEFHNKGTYEIQWDGRVDRGQKLPTSVYLIQIEKEGVKKEAGIYIKNE